MKLEEIMEKEESKPGTYAGVHFSPATLDSLEQYVQDNKIPSPLEKDHFHTTVLYSRKHLPDFEPAGDYDTPMIGVPKKFEIWPSQPDESGHVKKCLVLTYKCDELCQRHKDLMTDHGATYDFDEYKPHVTLSYDIGDFDISELPEFEEELEITNEYGEELKQSWADDKKKKEE